MATASETKTTTNYTNLTNEKDSVVVAARDTLKEVTTVTVILREPQDRQRPPDTVKVSTVTDRTRASVRDRVKEVEVKVVEKHDTVFVQKTDSVYVQNTNLTNPSTGSGRVASVLKWVFGIVVAICILVIIFKVKE